MVFSRAAQDIEDIVIVPPVSTKYSISQRTAWTAVNHRPLYFKYHAFMFMLMIYLVNPTDALALMFTTGLDDSDERKGGGRKLLV